MLRGRSHRRRVILTGDPGTMDHYFSALWRPRSLRRPLSGQALVEYMLILLLIALAVFATLAAFGPTLTAAYERVVTSFP